MVAQQFQYEDELADAKVVDFLERKEAVDGISYDTKFKMVSGSIGWYCV